MLSNEWLTRFKRRLGISSTAIDGESGSVNIEAIREHLELVRDLTDEYNPANIYNYVEIGSNFKHMPLKKLSTKQTEGKKLFENRFTILFCCNRDGSYKFKPWFVGTALKHRSFGKDSIENLNCIWTKSKNAWMTAEIVEEWFSAFKQDVIQHGKQFYYS